jgi:hypothetical protein
VAQANAPTALAPGKDAASKVIVTAIPRIDRRRRCAALDITILGEPPHGLRVTVLVGKPNDRMNYEIAKLI